MEEGKGDGKEATAESRELGEAEEEGKEGGEDTKGGAGSRRNSR